MEVEADALSTASAEGLFGAQTATGIEVEPTVIEELRWVGGWVGGGP